MAFSPKFEVFFLKNQTTGSPVTGQTIGGGGIHFLTYKSWDGATAVDVSQPTIVELGGGAYGFLPVFASNTLAIFYTVTTGSGVIPTAVDRYMRPEDWTTDDIITLKDVEIGKWQLFKSGPNATQLWLYHPDGSVLQKFQCYDALGNPSSSDIYQRVPI